MVMYGYSANPTRGTWLEVPLDPAMGSDGDDGADGDDGDDEDNGDIPLDSLPNPLFKPCLDHV